jgi:hypothetical protein
MVVFMRGASGKCAEHLVQLTESLKKIFGNRIVVWIFRICEQSSSLARQIRVLLFCFSLDEKGTRFCGGCAFKVKSRSLPAIGALAWSVDGTIRQSLYSFVVFCKVQSI